MQPLPDHESNVIRLELPPVNPEDSAELHVDPVNSLSDHQLFECVKRGNADALRALYDRYAAKVYRIAKRLIQDEQAVQEVMQDVFTRIWTTQAFDANLGAFNHWLVVVARRVTIDHVRRHRHVTAPWPAADLASADDNTEQTVSRRILRNDLRVAMAKMDDDLRVVLQLAYFQGYTLTEVASALEIPLGTVKTRLHKGLKAMRMELAEWIEEVRP